MQQIDNGRAMHSKRQIEDSQQHDIRKSQPLNYLFQAGRGSFVFVQLNQSYNYGGAE